MKSTASIYFTNPWVQHLLPSSCIRPRRFVAREHFRLAQQWLLQQDMIDLFFATIFYVCTYPLYGYLKTEQSQTTTVYLRF